MQSQWLPKWWNTLISLRFWKESSVKLLTNHFREQQSHSVSQHKNYELVTNGKHVDNIYLIALK